MKLVKKSNGYYYARFKGSDGLQKEVSTRVKRKDEADQVVKESNLEALELAAKAQILTADAISKIVSGRKVSIKAALDQWEARMTAKGRSNKTAHNNCQTVSKWVKEAKLGTRPPSAINLDHVNNYINNPRSKVKASTRRTNLTAIRTFIEFCVDEGWRSGNPAKNVDVVMSKLTHKQKEKKEVELFTRAEVIRICNKAEVPFWTVAPLISYETGLRLGDICCLEWASLSNESLTVWTDKSDKRIGPLPLGKVLMSRIREVPMMSKRFMFPDQEKIYRAPTRRALLSVQFKNLCAKADIEGKTFHGLRHTYASRTFKDEKETLIQQLQRELAELKVASNMGHSETKTTKGYIH